MTFKVLQKETTGPSPAVELHLTYVRKNGKSKVQDWKLILQRGFSFAEANGLISFLENRGLALPATSTIVNNLGDLMAQAACDPVACGVQVTAEALDLWEHVCSADWGIDAEYIQDALNRYRGYLATDPWEYSEHLPPKEFVFEWFTVVARYGSPRMRRYHLEHPKWKEYVELIKKAKKRG